MAKTKQNVNLHAKKYIDTVFRNRLLEEGFVCPNDKSLCWYRVCGGEVVHSIVFFSCWNHLPVMLDMGYGIHPLFQKPAYTTSVNYSNRPLADEILFAQMLVENCDLQQMGYINFSQDILVMAPGRDGKGIYTFDGIVLPQMERAHSIVACYELHKEKLISRNQSDQLIDFRSISDSFFDEAIYVNDTEVYPFCHQRAEFLVNLYGDRLKNNPNDPKNQLGLQNWTLRLAALCDGEREGYLSILEKRKGENIRYLKKQLGVDIF